MLLECWKCLNLINFLGYFPSPPRRLVSTAQAAIFKTGNGESGNPGIGESGNPGIGESGNRGIRESGNPGIIS